MQDLTPLHDTHAVRSGKNGRLRKADEQTMLHDPGNGRKRLRQRLGIANAAERGVDNPVAAIRDERMAVFALPQL